MGQTDELFKQACELENSGDIEKAKKIYMQILNLDPNHVFALCSLGVLMLCAGTQNEAINEFRDAIKKADNPTDAYNEWGNAYMALKKYKEAIAKYKKCIEIDANYKWAYCNIGNAYRELGQYEGAVKYFKLAIEKDENYVDAYWACADLLFELKRYEEALKLYLKCKGDAGETRANYYNIAICYYMLQKYSDAIDNFKRTIESETSVIPAYNAWGDLLFDISRFEEAGDKYNKCLELDPDYAINYCNLGQCYYELEELDKAIECYQIAVNNGIIRVDVFNGWGDALFELGRYDDAIEKYKRCVDIDPHFKVAYNNLGLAYKEIKQYESAVVSYQVAISKDHNYTDAYNDWGDVLFELDRHGEAIEKYLKCVEINPDYKLAYCNLGMAYSAIGEFDNANKYFKQAIEKDQSFVDAYNEWGASLLKQEKFKEAIEALSRLLKIDPESISAYCKIGHAYKYLKQYDMAAKNYTAALERDADYVEALNAWGDMLYDQKQYDNALQKYYRSIEINADLKSGYCGLGKVFKELKQYDNAAKSYKVAIQKDENHAIAYNGLGTVLYCLKKYDEAVVNYKRCVEIDPDFKEAYNNLGALFQELGNYAESSQYYKLAVENDATYFTACIGWGNTLLFEKKYDEAIKMFNRGLKYDTDNIEAYNNLAVAYGETGNLSTTLDIFEYLLKKDRKNWSASYNKGLYLLTMGRYKEGRDQMRDVIDLLIDEIKQNENIKNNINVYQIIGFIYKDTFHDFKASEDIALKGIKIDDKNIELHSLLNELYLELNNCLISTNVEYVWKAKEMLSRAEKAILTGKKGATGDQILAEMYFNDEQFDKAGEIVENIIKKDEMNDEAYNCLGRIHIKLKDYAKAISLFKKACGLKVYKLSYKDNLASAYYLNSELEKAENEFKSILKIDQHNIDALIGIGEVYLSLGEQKDGDAELFELADKYFLEALDKGQGNKASKILNRFEPDLKVETRKYKDLELSDLYYSLGYLKVKQFEAGNTRFDRSMIVKSERYFKLSSECNPDNHKAIRAKNKIQNMLKVNRPENFTDKFGPWIVSGIAFTIFLLCQLFFFIPGENAQKKLFNIGDQNLSIFKSVVKINKSEFQELGSIKNVNFEDKKSLLISIENIIGKQNFNNYLKIINKIDFSKVVAQSRKHKIPAGYYVLISFGSILFIIVGFYMPRLLKLKISPIELEKNVSRETSKDFSIRISR